MGSYLRDTCMQGLKGDCGRWSCGHITLPSGFPRERLMKRSITLHVNGVARTADVEPRALLAYVLRDQLDLTGTHIGCDTSQCGACTVHVDGKAIKSCTLFAVQADGHDIKTIEGMATHDGALHPIQQAFWDEHGLQCGYCTPGFIMAAAYLLEQNPSPTDDEIRKGLEGNLCRCTGYVNIVKAVASAAKTMSGSAPAPAPSASPVAGE